jgi:hypothetical protein
VISIDEALAETTTQLWAAQVPSPPLRSWSATVAGPWGVPFQYDCRAANDDRARAPDRQEGAVCAGLRREIGACGVFAPPEVGDPR